MCRSCRLLLLTCVVWLSCYCVSPAVEPPSEGALPSADHSADVPADSSADVAWQSSYAEAMELAEAQGKMMLIFFYQPGEQGLSHKFESNVLADADVVEKMRDYVCARLPVDAKVLSNGEEVSLLEHAAFKEMLGQPGVAILDFVHKETDYYGRVVSVFPLTQRLWYTPQQMAVILDLPPGTLTQRTLIFAVRTHPDKPASSAGEPSPILLEEAQGHSRYQARICLQGHHRWGWRFQRINARLPRGLTAGEVCAESLPGEGLVEAAIGCVRCWRLSSGHWSAVRARHRYYGYDMKRGRNGVWYATGIFSGQ